MGEDMRIPLPKKSINTDTCIEQIKKKNWHFFKLHSFLLIRNLFKVNRLDILFQKIVYIH